MQHHNYGSELSGPVQRAKPDEFLFGCASERDGAGAELPESLFRAVQPWIFSSVHERFCDYRQRRV